MGLHGALGHLGHYIGTCRVCGRRDPAITTVNEECGMCFQNPAVSYGGESRRPPLFSEENGLSIGPSRGGMEFTAEDEPEWKGLLELLGGMSVAEVSLIKAATPCVSYHILPKGQFGYRGHAISLSNNGPMVAMSLPRSPGDAGLSLIVENGGLDKAKSDKRIVRMFRVRRARVQRVLELLIKHNKYYAMLYSGVNMEALSRLPVDGIPDDLPVLMEDRAGGEKLPGELMFTVGALREWLEAGEEYLVDMPIAPSLRKALQRHYCLPDDVGRLAHDIQRAPSHHARQEMTSVSDLVSFIVEIGRGDVLPGFHDNKETLVSRRRNAVPVSSGHSGHSADEKKERKRNEEAARRAEVERHEAWRAIDVLIVGEFERMAKLAPYREDLSCVPAGFVARRTVEEAESAVVGELLQDEKARAISEARAKSREHGGDSSEALERGAALNEGRAGFWPLCYPELFPFGNGCFNEPRHQKVSFREWQSWALTQDSRVGCPPEPAQPSTLSSSAQVEVARGLGTPVRFVGSKTAGTASGNRFRKYSSSTTIEGALRAGATRADLRYDFENGILVISNVEAPRPHSGSGSMRHMSNRDFSFHTVNRNFRDISSTHARAFLRQVPGVDPNDAVSVGKYLRDTDPGEVSKRLLRFSKSIPGTPQFFHHERKNLHNMIDELGPPTIFATASAADTHCPHLHKLIVEWAGLAGSSKDPFVCDLTPAEVRKRRHDNLVAYPAIASWYWDKKVKLIQEKLLPALGVVAFWERTEYQSRGSAHGHALWWIGNAPPDAFLDVITNFATGLVRAEAEETGGEESFNEEKALRVANDLASCSPAAFEYDGEAPRLDARGMPVFRADYAASIGLTISNLNRQGHAILEAVHQARVAAVWYARLLDASSALYDEASRTVADMAMLNGYPCEVNPCAVADKSHAATKDDYDKIRCATARHTECRESYCLREKKATKKGSRERYCRFADSLKIRDFGVARDGEGDHEAQSPRGGSDEAAGGGEGAVGTSEDGDPALRVRAPTHYFAELASAKDGTCLLRWRLYVGKGPGTREERGGEDPRMNSCCPSHVRIHRSNCDAKACVDKYGVCMYVTKTANYISKAEVPSKQFSDILQKQLHSPVHGAAPSAPLRGLLFEVCKRDYSAQEVNAIALNLRSTSSSHSFKYCTWSRELREASAEKEPGVVSTRWNDFEVYLNRRKILSAMKPSPSMAMSKRIMAMDFMEFSKKTNCEFNPASKKKRAMHERFSLLEEERPHLRICVPVPDLPIQMRDRQCAEHERYCEFRVSQFKVYRSEEEHEETCLRWERLAEEKKVEALGTKEDARARGERGRWHLEYMDLIEQHERHLDDLEAAVAAAVKGNDARAVASAMGTLKGALESRKTRLMKKDGDKDGSELEDVNSGDEDVVLSASEDLGCSVDPQFDRQIETPVNLEYWGEVRDTYLAAGFTEETLSRDWITEAIDGVEKGHMGEIESLPNQRPVDCETLNSAQRFLLMLLARHYDDVKSAIRSKSALPKPLGLTVYGEGGTGKSHVLRAFQQVIDDDSDPLSTTDINPEAEIGRALRSDDLVMVMAPTALAAQSVRGDTVHACVQYPRTFGNEKRLDPSCLEDKTDKNKNGFSEASRKKLERRHRYKHFYFIDESGMVGAEMIAVIAKRLQQAHYASMGSAEFGGRSVILFGHHAQLSPAGDKRVFVEHPPKDLFPLQV